MPKLSPTLNLISSSLASTLRLWNGTWGRLASTAPGQTLQLFDREDDARCRLVREVLTELNLDVMIYPCPLGGKRFAKQRRKLAPSAGAVPVLHDPNTGRSISSAGPIIDYLFQHYAREAVPRRLRLSLLAQISSGLASLVRPGSGLSALPSRVPKHALTLYSFESSPFSRLVREQLCQLELPYLLINLGKTQWADMGPASFRFAPGPYQPLPDSKRERFLQQYGKVQVPFLIDPNHQVSMFESQDILQYLHKTWAKTD